MDIGYNQGHFQINLKINYKDDINLLVLLLDAVPVADDSKSRFVAFFLRLILLGR